MPKYKVSFEGWYIIEADNVDDAIGTCVEDFGVEYAEWENLEAEEMED